MGGDVTLMVADVMGIADDELRHIPWHEVCETISVASARKSHFAAELTSLEITALILRQENYMV